MLATQNGCCAICLDAAGDGGAGLNVDHDHDTGKVRGLLCHHCNIGLGHLRDQRVLAAAIAYLEAAA
jgi:hypothetical protein